MSINTQRFEPMSLEKPKTNYKLEKFLDPNRSEVVLQVRRIRGRLRDLSKELPEDVKKNTALGDLEKVRTGHYAEDDEVRNEFGHFLEDLVTFLNTDIPLHKKSEGYALHATRFKQLRRTFAKVIKSGTFGVHTNPAPQNLNKKAD